MTDSVEQPHPEELRASAALRLGDRIAFEAKARTTPAGIVAIGVTVAAILVATAVLVRAARPRPWHQRF